MIDILMIGRAIRRKRNVLGISQIRLRNDTGVSQQVISKIECGIAANVGVKTLDKIAEGLGLKLSELIAGAENHD